MIVTCRLHDEAFGQDGVRCIYETIDYNGVNSEYMKNRRNYY